MAKRFSVDSFDSQGGENNTPANSPFSRAASSDRMAIVRVAAHVPPVDPRDDRGIAFTFNFDMEADVGENTLWDLQGTVEDQINARLDEGGAEYEPYEWRLFAAKTKDSQGKDVMVSHQTFLTRATRVLLKDAFVLGTGSRQIVCYGLLYLRGSDDHQMHQASTVAQIKKIKK